jgi:molybdopterin/thiamine biosynthesis adenylyltransferase
VPVDELMLPRLKPAVQVIDVEGADLRLRASERDFAIDDPPAWAASFFRALDGERELPVIASALRDAGADVSPDELAETLVQLQELGLVEDAADDRLLTDGERERYDRQLRYFGDSAAPGASAASHQIRLREATVAVLGLGALGGHAAQALAAAGVGTITAVDGDVVELSNLNRQTLYSEADVGRLKADVAAERIVALNSTVRFRAETGWLDGQRSVEAAIEGADLVVDAVDSPPYEIERWVNDACFRLGIPYIGMSHYPPWVRIGPTYVPGETGCYRCQEIAWQEADPLFDVTTDRRLPSAIAPTAATAGAIVAMEAIHHLTGIARPGSLGAAVLIDLSTLSVERRPVVRSEGCVVCADVAAA